MLIGDRARRVASAAAVGGGGAAMASGALLGVLFAQAKLARRTIGVTNEEPPPDATGWYGRGRQGPAFKIALLGDSSAAGYGVETVEHTPGCLMATAVAENADRRVYLKEVCVVGAESAALAAQIDRALLIEPDVAVILIGANDVTHLVPLGTSVKLLRDGVKRLRAAGVEVVVGTCPDLGTIKPIAVPLRQVARAWSRQLAAAQTVAVIEEGARTVSLSSVLGPEFDAAPALLFGPDRFHPSAAGYRALAVVMVPSILAALGDAPSEEARPLRARGEGVMPVSKAALQAVREPGTELDGKGMARKGGLQRVLPGQLVALRRRRNRLQPAGSAPEDSENTDG